jgi:hypothetical protein
MIIVFSIHLIKTARTLFKTAAHYTLNSLISKYERG